MDADVQERLDKLTEQIEKLAKLHAEDAPAEKIEAQEEKVEKAAERAGLSDEDADRLADRISAKLSASIDPDALAGKVAENLKEWADEAEPGEAELEKLGGQRPEEKPDTPAAEKPEPGEEDKPDAEPGDGAPSGAPHFTERKLADLFR
jgi:translation initiation factor IF-2